MPDAPGEKRSGTIQSVSIAARFLKTLANAEGELALGEVARRTGTGGSTAHRYLQSLVKEGLARQDPLSGLYDLGPAALSIGIGALKRIDAVDIAARHMKALAQRHAASGGVAIWTERGPTLVRWYRSAYFSINPLALGDILPIDNTACGLVFRPSCRRPWSTPRASSNRRTSAAARRAARCSTRCASAAGPN